MFHPNGCKRFVQIIGKLRVLVRSKVCFSGSILKQTFDIEVVSYDGTSLENMKNDPTSTQGCEVHSESVLYCKASLGNFFFSHCVSRVLPCNHEPNQS